MTLSALQQGSNAVHTHTHTQVILSPPYEILGSHSSVAEDSSLLGCDMSPGE